MQEILKLQTLLRIENLHYQYPSYPNLKFPPLLKGVNLVVKSGEIKVILGKPESGKSTLLKIILSLIPRYTAGVISGKVEFDGVEISQYKPFELINLIGAVFQDPDEQIVTTSVESEIAFTLESLGLEREDMKARVKSALSKMGIEKLWNRNPATLSGGEKKKLLLASLYTVDPKLWLMDDILDELDPATSVKILQNMVVENKTVILFSSKMFDVFQEIQCNILVLSEGTLIDISKMDSEAAQKLLVSEGLIINPENLYVVKDHQINKPGTYGTDFEEDKLIEIKNLNYRYPDNYDFSLFVEHFTLKRGEIVALAGKNGSGKSTLGKIIAGLKEKESGILRVTEKNNQPPAYLFQNPDYQIFLPTVEEELCYGLHLTENKINNAITCFNLPNRNVPPSLMSYGARKRLQAAVYYLMDRDIYILDEADAGLSLEDFDNLINLLYKKEKGILIISHNMNLCSRYSNRAYLIDEGRIEREVRNDLYSNLISFFDVGESYL